MSQEPGPRRESVIAAERPRGPKGADPRTLLSEEAAELLALKPSFAARGLAYLLVALAAAALAWGALAPIELSVSADALLETEPGTLLVRAPVAGTLLAVSVHEGDAAASGSTLFRLASPDAARAVAAVERAERALASAEGELARFPARRERSEKRLAWLRERLAALEELDQKDLEIASALRSAGERERAASSLRLAEVERARLEDRAAAAGLRAEIDDARAALDVEPTTLEARRDEARRELTGAQHLAPAGASDDQLLVRAPVDGVVVALVPRQPGDLLAVGDVVLTLRPKGAHLVALARVRPQDARSLAPGQRARVRCAGFASRDVGGRVERVSSELVAQATGASSESRPWQLVTVALDEEKGSGKPELGAGLAATVEVVTGEATALELLLRPARALAPGH